MKTARSILSLVLAVILAAGVIVVPGFSEETKEQTYKAGDTVEFGSYPQTEIKALEYPEDYDEMDEEAQKEFDKKKAETDDILARLERIANSVTWEDYNYYSGDNTWKKGGMKLDTSIMSYIDITLNDEEGNETKYRGVKIKNYRPYFTGYSYVNDKGEAKPDNTYQDENGYFIGNTYWFKYEPIEWIICDISVTAAGATVGYAITKKTIDSQAYQNFVKDWENDKHEVDGFYYNDKAISKARKPAHEKKNYYYANHYETSTIIDWLNKDFAGIAFAGEVVYSNVKNNELLCIENLTQNNSSEYTKYRSESTVKRVFLPSKSEATSKIKSSYLKADCTDYAKSQGLWVDPDVKSSYWRLRTAGEQSSAACFVNSSGNVSVNNDVDFTCAGIRPAIYLNLPIHDHDNYKSEYTTVDEKKVQKCKVCGKIIDDSYVRDPITHAEVDYTCNKNGNSPKRIHYGQKVRITAEVDNIPRGVLLVWYFGDGTEEEIADSDALEVVEFPAAVTEGTYVFTTEKFNDQLVKDGYIASLNDPQDNPIHVTAKLFWEDYTEFVDLDGKTKYDTKEIKVSTFFLWRIVDFFRTLLGIDSVVKL